MHIGLREAIFFLALLGIPVSVWFFVFQPNNADAEAIRDEIHKKERKLELVNRASATIDDLRQQIQSLEKAMVYFRTKLPNERQIPDVLKDISELVETHGLRQGAIRPARKALELLPPGSPYSEMSFEVEVAGNYMDFYGFLQAIEALPRITRIQSLVVRGLGLNEVQKAEEEMLEGAEEPEMLPGEVKGKFVMTIFYANSQ